MSEKKLKKIWILFLLWIALTPQLGKAEEVEIYSKNMVLINLKENTVVDEKEKEEPIAIASMTKIMTAYTAILQIQNLDEKVRLTGEVFRGLAEENASVAGFQIGEEVTYRDLLYGTLLPSGADAANALAIFLTGSREAFVELMNEEAEKMHLQNTHFVNMTGLDVEGHYSTVMDVATMLKNAYQNETFREIFTSQSYTTSDRKLTFHSTFQTTLSKFHLSAPYVVGAKTGYTLKAGRCLASIAYDEKNDISYLLVTARAPITTSYYHVQDAITVYEHFFENYAYQTLIEKGDTLVTLKTKSSAQKEVTIKASEDVLQYLKNDYRKDDVLVEYEGVDTVTPSMKENTKLGDAKVYYQGTLVTTIPIVLEKAIPFSIVVYLQEHIYLVSFLLFLIFALLLSCWRRKKQKRKRKVRKNRSV